MPPPPPPAAAPGPPTPPERARAGSTRALAWTVLEGGGLTVLSLVSLIVFARLLTPEAVGLAALALGVVQLLNLPVEMLFHDALVQQPEVRQAHFDAAFTVSLALGAALAALCWAASGLVESILGVAGLGPVLAGMGLSLPSAGLASALVARDRRDFAFRRLAARSLIARGGAMIAAIALALAGYGVWALVAQQVLQVGLSALALWIGAPHRPRLRAAWPEARSLLAYGGRATAALGIEFLVQRVLLLQVGATLGAGMAGQFSLALRLVEMLRATIAGAVAQLALPLFARLQHEPRLLRRAFTGATELTCALAFPAFGGLAAVMPQLIEGVFGAQWLPAATPATVLCLLALLHFARLYAAPALLARGRPGDVLAVRAAELPVLAVAPLAGIATLPLAAAVWCVRALLALPVELALLARATGLRPRAQWHGLPSLAAMAIGMALAVRLAATELGTVRPLLALVLLAALGATLWTALLLLLRPTLARRLLALGGRVRRA